MACDQKMYQYMNSGFKLNMSEITRVIKSTLPEGLTNQQKKQKIEFEKQNVERAMYAQNDLEFVLSLFNDWRWNHTNTKPHETPSVALAKGINQYFLENNRFGIYLEHVNTAFEEVNDIYDFSLTKTQLDEKKPESAIITRSVMTVFKNHEREMDDCVRQWGAHDGASDARELQNNFRVTSSSVCQQIGESCLNGNFNSYAQQFGVPVEALTTMCQPLIQLYISDQDRQNKAKEEADRRASHRRLWANYPFLDV